MASKSKVDSSWMIYGANGYTGTLIARKAAERGLRPVLAGRNEKAVHQLAEELGLDWRVFDLNDGKGAAHLKGMQAVLHCAGPFSATSRLMIDACLEASAHYLDITGEIEVLEATLARDAEAKTAGITLLSGVGFDVVPSDCLAARLAGELPGSTDLELAFISSGGISPGTLKTAVESLPEGGRARRAGKVVETPLGSPRKDLWLGDRRYSVAAVPWGDVATAFHSTGIPNITTYTALPRSSAIIGRLARRFSPLFGSSAVQGTLKRLIEKHVPGPSEGDRKKNRVLLWGKVRRGNESREAWLETSEGYRFTCDSALACLDRVLRGSVKPGASTPSQAFGIAFVDEIEGTRWLD